VEPLDTTEGRAFARPFSYARPVVIPARDKETVMPGLVPGIHAFSPFASKTWMAGTSPAMTLKREG